MEPFDVDFSSVGAAVATFFQLVGAILRREDGIIAEVYFQPGVLQLSVVIVLLAGFSEAIGQIVVLFANEVKPRRMVMSLMLSSVLFLGGYLMWAGTIWLLALIVFRPDVSFTSVLRAVGLGYAPLLFGWMGLTPYFGSGILTLLYFWSFTAIVSAVSISLGLAVWQAVIISVGGGLLILRARATLGRPLVKAARRVRNAAAGRRLVLRIQEAVEERTFELFEMLEPDGTNDDKDGFFHMERSSRGLIDRMDNANDEKADPDAPQSKDKT
ncbi:MAG: hypothetical protein AAF125_17790 [Chloroflexota bacterium]